ncbi:MAG TPA: type II toxin-antitoxin system Phd/YefM family antitoxin [Myxococcota bacterium]|nr:type II toxin-antitoxin system Phd/YefM family antitoxin [Myxococcota bacterium]
MKQVNIHFAKTHLSNLLREVEEGAVIVIAKAGMPIAKIVPIKEKLKKRELGLDRGKFEIPDDFNEPLAEIEQMFYGNNKDHN